MTDWQWLLFGWSIGFTTGYVGAYIRFIAAKRRRFATEAKAFEKYFEMQQAQYGKNRFDL